jgi:two-component system response regulator
MIKTDGELGMDRKTILLVEDNENDEWLTRRALSKLNQPINLVAAKDGVEALDYLHGQSQDDHYDLPICVLLDLKLPRIDGLQVLKEIRSNDKTRLLPVMIVTSSAEEIDVKAANQLAVTSYTVKPSDSREYTETIQKLVISCLLKDQ